MSDPFSAHPWRLWLLHPFAWEWLEMNVGPVRRSFTVLCKGNASERPGRQSHDQALLCGIWNCALCWIFLNVRSVPRRPRCVHRFLYPLRAASWWDLGYAKECHSRDAGPPAPPVRHSVPASHSGIQYSGFPLQWLQKYRWAHSRWTCHSQHLQDPNSQQGKTEGQRKFCCEEFCWATWGA